MKARGLLASVAIAILVAVAMTAISVVPPFSAIYSWLARNDLAFVWYGLVAGIIALCITLYHRRRERRK